MRKKAKLESNEKLSAMERHERISCLTMDGCPIEDLGLDFTLPGYPNIGNRTVILNFIGVKMTTNCEFDSVVGIILPVENKILPMYTSY